MGWDQSKVISELRRLQRQKKDLSFTAQMGSGLWAAAQRYFGAYRIAVEAAGIDYHEITRRRNSKWSHEKICETLQKQFRAKRDISSRTLRRTNSQLHAAAIHWFGSYRQAIVAAKIDYARVSRRSTNVWSKEAIIKEIRRLHKLRTPLHHAAMERSNPHLVVVSYRYFGTYRKAITAAGLDYLKVRVRPPRTWTRERIEILLRKLEKAKTGLWERQVRRSQPYLPRAARQLFGSYPAAARSAGIDAKALQPPEYRFWSPERVLAALKKMHDDGKPMYPTRLLATQPYLFRVAARRFGSYKNAIEAAGLEYPVRPLRHWSEKLVLQTIRELHREGEDLRYAVTKKKRLPLYEAARYYFGSYINAVRVAGIDYEKIVKTHLRRSRLLPRQDTRSRRR